MTSQYRKKYFYFIYVIILFNVLSLIIGHVFRPKKCGKIFNFRLNEFYIII